MLILNKKKTIQKKVITVNLPLHENKKAAQSLVLEISNICHLYQILIIFSQRGRTWLTSY